MPGDSLWISIYGTADGTVPTWSSELDGAINIELEGLEHFGPNGVLEHVDALDDFIRALLWK